MANQSRRVVIAGGSGFLGHSLATHLTARGMEVIVLSRRAAGFADSVRRAEWDARALGGWMSALDGADALINLAGRSVDCVKTPDHCDEILRSRVESTLVLGRACREVGVPPCVWVQMSTAHIYGDPPETVCDEESPTGYGLAPTVGRAWEAAFAESLLPTQRGVVLRTSFVLGRPNAGGRGALGKLGLLAKLGLGGRVGTGRQGMSWIHEQDLNRMFERAILDESIRGMHIASSPNPQPQAEFMRELRGHARGLGGLGLGLPAFEWMVRLGAPLLFRSDPELALFGRFVLPRRFMSAGFEFSFPTLRGALADVFMRG